MWYAITGGLCFIGGVYCARKYWGKSITLGNALLTKARNAVREGEDAFKKAEASLLRFIP